MGYADALIPGKALIEMKQRGEGLGQHFPQLQRYWFNLAPKPTYAILCNFDQFWVYDFNIQVDEPVEQLQTEQIAERWSGLAFLSKAPETPLFGNNQISVTEKQAQAMGHLFHDLKAQAAKTDQFSAQQAQRFVLQCVLCMFAEDRGMLPNRQFSLALEDCREKGDENSAVGAFALIPLDRGKPDCLVLGLSYTQVPCQQVDHPGDSRSLARLCNKNPRAAGFAKWRRRPSSFVWAGHSRSVESWNLSTPIASEQDHNWP